MKIGTGVEVRKLLLPAPVPTEGEAGRRNTKHFNVQALNLAWYRAGTNDEDDSRDRMT
jgi:hypothetical protein